MTLIAIGAVGACTFVIGYILGALTAAGARTDQEFDDYLNKKDEI